MPKGFFRAIWRFNALSFAAVSCLALFVGAYAAFQIARDVFYRPYQAHDIARVETKDDANAPPKIRTDLAVLHFSRIRGTDTLWSNVVATQTYDFRYSSKDASSTRNIIFYDMTSGQSRKLLPDDNRLIIESRELRDGGRETEKPPKALLFALVEKDSNGDGLLNNSDAQTVALARPNGEDLTRITEVVGTFKGEVLAPGEQDLVLMLEKDGQIKALHINLANFKVTKTEQIAR